MHQGKDVQSPGDARAEADPTSEVRGARFQQNLVVKSHNGFTTAREMKHTSQPCYDKIMDNKMALCRECCFPKYKKSWRIKLIS